MNLTYILVFGTSLGLALGLTPLVIRLARLKGFIVQPREDRWSRRPTALLGGIAIYVAVAVPFVLYMPLTKETIGILAALTAVFILGLIDDIWELPPQRKFLLQIVIAAAVVLVGVRLIIIEFAPLAVFVTILWIVGITNAINILDNMDGLSAGISFVASVFSFIYALMTGLPFVALFALALAGAALGFLVYNFNPARIFMGDCGSLFLGMSLSLLSILGTWREATNLMASLIFPVALLAVPIFDTTLVSFVRTQVGRSIAQGGRDHSSHRLVFLGLSERRAVVVLMLVAAVFGAVAVLLKDLSFLSTLIIMALLVIGLITFGIFLGGVRVYSPGETGRPRLSILNGPLIASILIFKKQIFQILVDTSLVGTAYFSAFLFRFGQALHSWEIMLIERSLPLVVLANLVAFAWFGIYKGDWRYASIHDLSKVFKGVSLGWLLSLGLIFVVMGSDRPPLGLLATFYFLNLILIAGVRLSQRALKEYFSQARILSDPEAKPVLIFGAGDGGELLVRELRNNVKLKKRPVGFIDDDKSKHGLQIHGLKVYGGRGSLADQARRLGVGEVYIAILSGRVESIEEVEEICRRENLVCRRITPIIQGLENGDREGVRP